MMSSVKRLFNKFFSWIPFYKIILGGYRYHSYIRATTYEPSQFCRFGKGAKICQGVRIRAPGKMKIGDGVFIGLECIIDALGGLEIGNCCALAARTTVITADHQYRGAESIPWGETRIVKPVVLEDYVWIGMNASILPGVTIGEGAIVGLGAIVTKDVPSCAVVVGNPARIVKYRDKEHFSSMKKSRAVKTTSECCTKLWIPPEMRERHHELLMEVGYDVEGGHENFEFKAED